MAEVYTNPAEKNDTNEANLSRVIADSQLEEEIEQIVDRLINENPDSTISVIQMDMDKSVEIRKSGISYKLQVLKETAEILKSYESENCFVIPHGTRDDVTIIKINSDDIALEEQFVSEVLRKLENTPVGHGMDRGPFHVTYSAGIAIYPVHGKTAAQLLQLADGAVRKAKDNGRNSFEIAETGFHYSLTGVIDDVQWKKLFKISVMYGKTMDELIREGFEEIFQKHSALYRFCCQENE